MCGRAKLPLDCSEIKIRLKLDDLAPAPNWSGSWNLAPTQDMLTVVHDPSTGKRISIIARWGLIPHWAKDPAIGAKMFNAPAETVDTLPAFRNAWKKGQRRLVVTDGFYEWRKGDREPPPLPASTTS